MTHARLALASTITAMLIVAGGVVAVRSSAGSAALAWIAGGRSVAAAELGGAPSTGAPAAPVSPLALPLSNPTSLEPALAAAGYALPAGASVYAAKVNAVGGTLTYDDYQAGAGALATNFWPASSIKVLAAVGALEFVGRQGFTGAATVSFGGGAPQTIRSIYEAAIRVSSNADYDTLVEIAGVDWLNNEFLTPARGFPATVIQQAYTVGGDLRTTPAMTISEGTRKATIPARTGTVNAACPPGNCSNLFEMSESVRRVVLHYEIPTAERFALAPADVAGLTAALLTAEGWFEPAVAKVLGPAARIYGKPGEVPERDCLDVTLIQGRDGRRLLLSATVPEPQGGCPALVDLAAAVLKILTS
jgi:hypothetical protein